MKLTNSIIFLILLSSSYTFAASTNLTPAEKFLNAYIKGDYESSAQLVYCPKQYSKKKKAEEYAQLAKEFEKLSNKDKTWQVDFGFFFFFASNHVQLAFQRS